MLFILLWQCQSASDAATKPESKRIALPEVQSFNSYWYDHGAEVTRYALKQARYGQIHSGEAVLIFVTEPFLTDKQVKADDPSAAAAVPILKLNFTKKFPTGVYPYSLMSSAFTPLVWKDGSHASREEARPSAGPVLKITTSIQEWCGHVFLQLNKKEPGYHLSLKSYFESEGDLEKNLGANAISEDEIWNHIRLSPRSLPRGELNLIPSTQFLLLRHKEIKPYKARASLVTKGETQVYALRYPGLKRSLSIVFEKAFPHAVLRWEESHLSGFGAGAQVLTTKAERTHALTTDYWNKNRLSDSRLRKKLGLMY